MCLKCVRLPTRARATPHGVFEVVPYRHVDLEPEQRRKGGPGTTVPLHGEPGLNVMERLAAVALAQPPVVFSSRVTDGSRRQNMPPLSRRSYLVKNVQ